MEPAPTAVESQSLNHCTSREMSKFFAFVFPTSVRELFGGTGGKKKKPTHWNWVENHMWSSEESLTKVVVPLVTWLRAKLSCLAITAHGKAIFITFVLSGSNREKILIWWKLFFFFFTKPGRMCRKQRTREEVWSTQCQNKWGSSSPGSCHGCHRHPSFFHVAAARACACARNILAVRCTCRFQRSCHSKEES